MGKEVLGWYYKIGFRECLQVIFGEIRFITIYDFQLEKPLKDKLEFSRNFRENVRVQNYLSEKPNHFLIHFAMKAPGWLLYLLGSVVIHH